jgi:hypothetical protein
MERISPDIRAHITDPNFFPEFRLDSADEIWAHQQDSVGPLAEHPERIIGRPIEACGQRILAINLPQDVCSPNASDGTFRTDGQDLHIIF